MKLEDIREVAMVGAGTMGAGMSWCFAQAGYRVKLYDVSPQQLEKACARIDAIQRLFVEEALLSAEEAARRQEEAVIEPVVDGPALLAMQAALEDVTVEDSVGRYIVAIAAATREHPQVLVGASPRGSLALLLLSRARAALAGRDFVVPEDVKAVAVPALTHRITLRPEMWLRRIDPATVVTDVLAHTPAPASGALPSYGGRHG